MNDEHTWTKNEWCHLDRKRIIWPWESYRFLSKLKFSPWRSYLYYRKWHLLRKSEPLKSFSEVSFQGQHLAGINPSKELPLHKLYYEKSEEIQAVIHVHSFYATIFSFLDHPDKTDIVPDYTPYLKMKVGTIGLVPYAKPGSNELFGYFEKAAPFSDAFILAHHGPVVGGTSLMETFFGLEELEESCKIAWTFQHT